MQRKNRYRPVEAMEIEKSKEEFKAFFEGGGFPAFWFEIGYGKAMISQKSGAKLAGYSAGALCSAVLIHPEITVERVVDVCLSLVPECRPLRMGGVVTSMMKQLLPEDAHVKATGRIGIIVSDPSNGGRYKIYDSWETREQYIQCIVASCWIPFFMGCRLSDPVYHMRDGLFCPDLDDLRPKYDVVVDRPPSTESRWGRFRENMTVITKDIALDFAKSGAEEWARQNSTPSISQTRI